MSDNRQTPNSNPGSSREQQTNTPQDHSDGEDGTRTPLPSYSDYIPELPGESQFFPTEAYQPDVKTSSNGWPSEPLSQIPTAHSDLHNYNTGLDSPTASSLSTRAGSSVNYEGLAVPVSHDFIETAPPPAYSEVGESYLEIDQNGLSSKARILDDGRIDISINQRSRKFSNILLPALNRTLSQIQPPVALIKPEPNVPRGLQGKDVPKLNIVIQIIGSRGDVQPFVALGKVLKNNPPYHRVRIATHATFHKFVEENGLEFFSIGGDPAELMAFMVKNPGLMPGWDSLKQGDVGKRRKAMYEMLLGCWRSCIEGGNGLTHRKNLLPHTGEESEEGVFIADAIIANPPSFAHIHCAERLAIPLHLMFTMPWTPTQSFPHPLANIKSSNTEANITNFLTYTMVEMMTWQGLGDLVNKFREKTLGLDPVSTMWAPGMIQRLRVPHTYCWSPALIPKPQDWGEHIKISGFYFLDLANNYTPAEDLAAFLDAGPPPVYIGFGSIVVDDPNALTNMIFEAIRLTGIRALVSKGWGGLGGDSLQIPENVFMLGNCPHDWLFKRVACVVHHGGAGTTAIGIALGKPTVIVPFFGDQPFWGSMVHRAGAGPAPVPFKEMTAEILAASIKFALSPEAQTAAGKIAEKVKQEAGTVTGADSFHSSLDKQKLRCMVDPRRAAVWRIKRTEVRLSAVAAAFLQSQGLLYYSDLKLCRHQEWQTATGPIEPISGATSALLGTIGSVVMGVGDFPREIFKAAKQVTTKDDIGSNADSSSIASAPSTAPSTAPPTAPPTSSGSGSGNQPSLLSSSATHSRKPSFESSRDAEITSLSSFESRSELRSLQSNDSLEFISQPPPPPSAATFPQPTSNPIPHTSSFPSMTSAPGASGVSSHRAVMGSALSGVHRSRSNSPIRRFREACDARAEARVTRSSTDLPQAVGISSSRSSSPHRKLHKERTFPTDSRETHKLHKEHTSQSVPEAGRSATPSADSLAASQKESVNLEAWLGTGKGAGRIAGAVMKSPLDFTLALAQGFHNAPLLYGDTTVRKQEKITGMGSGLKVAGKEFAFGFYDGIAGLVTQPVQGAKEEGHLGFWKGFGKGIGGVVLKPGAAIWGVTGYTFKGLYEEIRKHSHTDISGYIVTARITEGIQELRTFQQSELETMLKRWKALNVERVGSRVKQKKDKGKGKEKEKEKEKEKDKKKKNKNKNFTCGTKDEVAVELAADEDTRAEEEIEDAPENRYCPTIGPMLDRETTEALASVAGYPARQPTYNLRAPAWSPDHVGLVQQASQPPAQRTLEGVENHEELERAIQESVRQTSRGNVHEDQLIEQAIRTSLAEVVNQDSGEDDDTVLRRAITASLANTGEPQGDEDAHAQAIQQAITKSLAESHSKQVHNDVDPDELARAIEESKNVAQPHQEANQDLELALQMSKREGGSQAGDVDDALQKALQISQEEEERRRQEKEEEETVMKYVMRMSLAEQKYKAFAIREDDGGASSVYGVNYKPGGSSKEAEQDELERAIMESLKFGQQP
ncbi:hypothetical protein AOL_s00004g573 [Orbilia oligospora ATCC 24927]|uniref:Uncharacterized protein n=2 Tax=Orbilia oligospora TaxID=2813651 RepID=G1WZ62_ARTOA|nr:hypothetical protein AOL_s00004g573 [Orbilia oligospora ATCC 24927]EGX53914.1 hypothetical protein AOL_s00004g573 [Orbilia oligospora ATCC 24927]KAF3275788.1 hypothetical protein TWF970_006678 [Orbilia oligospora]